MKRDKKSRLTPKQATKAVRKALLNVGAKDPGGIYQRLAVRKDHNTLIDHTVWVLFPQHWTSDALLLLLVEARILADADSYVNMGLLFRVFGINSDVVCDLLKKYPEHTPIYNDIKLGCRDRLMQGALDGTHEKYSARFILQCNFGMRPPEAELAAQTIEINMSPEAEGIMAETERLDALNAAPAVALPASSRPRGRPPKKGGAKTVPKTKEVGVPPKSPKKVGAKTVPKSKQVDVPEKKTP